MNSILLVPGQLNDQRLQLLEGSQLRLGVDVPIAGFNQQ